MNDWDKYISEMDKYAQDNGEVRINKENYYKWKKQRVKNNKFMNKHETNIKLIGRYINSLPEKEVPAEIKDGVDYIDKQLKLMVKDVDKASDLNRGSKTKEREAFYKNLEVRI